jgi:RND family efflux transporter MFP subunit
VKGTLLAAAIAVLLALTGWRIYRKMTESSGRPGDRERRPVPVEVAPVRRLTLRDVGTFTGSTEAEAYFVVAPKVSGRLESLSVDIGDTVTRGRVVAVLDDEEYAQGVEQARAELEVAKANVAQARSSLSVAKREHERIRELRRKGISSESDLDAARSGYEAEEARHQVALAEVSRREAALKAAEIRLSYTKIRASWEGGGDERVVGERFVDEGAMLSANTPIVSILDISSLTAAIQVIERDYRKLRKGQKVVVATDAFRGRSFAGTVSRIAPLLKRESRQARVEITVPNPERLLRPGMYVRAAIEFGRREDVLAVPSAAIVKRDGIEGIFTVGEAAPRPDEAGPSGGEEPALVARFVQVTTGVSEGDIAEIVEPALSGRVVTLGHHLLSDGSRVTVPADRTEEAVPPGETGAGRGGGDRP